MFDLLLEYFHEINKITGYYLVITSLYWQSKAAIPNAFELALYPLSGEDPTGTRLLVTVFFFGMHEIFHN